MTWETGRGEMEGLDYISSSQGESGWRGGKRTREEVLHQREGASKQTSSHVISEKLVLWWESRSLTGFIMPWTLSLWN